MTGRDADKTREDFIKVFNSFGLRITIRTNLKTVNFLDITLNLTNGVYSPYRKPNDRPMDINKLSNHPPNIIKNLPAGISRRLSDISHNREIFNQVTPTYNEALQSSGYTEKLSYAEYQPRKHSQHRQRNIIWFNPPFSKHVATNIDQKFLRLVAKHFPTKSKLQRLFNKNRPTVKVSYSCTPNVASIINAHNNYIRRKTDLDAKSACNCRKKDQCLMDGDCQAESIIYNAVRTASNNERKVYIGATENTFKQRYANHTQSMTHEKYENSTELSKYIWNLKRMIKEFEIKWSIKKRAQAYSSTTKRCHLCLEEKLAIIHADQRLKLNKRTELVSKCRHENKYLLSKQ